NCIPFGPAAGAISGLNIEEIKRKILDVAASDAAFVKWGSVTMFRNLGNDGKTYHHNEVTGVTSNSIGLSNPGLNVALQVQKEMQPQVEAKGKELIPSFSIVAGEDPLKILPVMAAKFANIGVKRMEINYSCGNKLSES